MSPREPALPRPQAPRLAWWLATGLGSGYLRPAPGTWGTLAGTLLWLPLAFGLQRLGGAWRHLGAWTAALLLTGVAVWASSAVVRECGEKDPSFVVIDEWAGVWFALAPLLAQGRIPPTAAGLLHLAAPFLLFRLFDIWKPGPVDWAQRLPGGWGVVLDDVLAGLLAALLTWSVNPWLHPQALGPWR